MSNIEMVHICNRESDYLGSPPATSDVKSRSDLSLGKNGTEEDLDGTRQTPTSSSDPLLSPFESGQSGRRSLLASVWQCALVFLAPTISIAYLAFCYVVHYRVVPANVSGLTANATRQFLSEHLPQVALADIDCTCN